MSKRVKLYNSKNNCKVIAYPKSFDELIQRAKEFVHTQDNTKRYQLIEFKAKREITTQEDFELMSEEFINEKVIKIRVNIVDKNTKYIIPNINPVDPNKIINESNISIIGKNQIKDSNKNVDASTNEIIKKKLKELEDKLVEELYNNSMMEIEKSQIMNKNKNLEKSQENIIRIHKGIICNKCGKEIIGKRFKCVQCQNFNLCEICESNYNHDMSHIMLSIIYPIENEKELAMKLDKNLSYKNKNLNYSLEPKIFYLNGESDIHSQEVTIKNTGRETWRNACLKCIENKSEIIGDDYKISNDVNPGKEIKIQITFYNLKNQLEEGKNIYYSFFEMFNHKNESFGNVTRIKIIINNSN